MDLLSSLLQQAVQMKVQPQKGHMTHCTKGATQIVICNIQQINTPMMIPCVLIFLSSRVIRQRKKTELIEDGLRDCDVSLDTGLTAIFNLCI